MTDRWFVDTNLLVYAADASHLIKQQQASAWMSYLWTTRSGRLSFQVLQEYYVTVTQKLKPGLAALDARADVVSLQAWQPTSASQATMQGAWLLQDRYSLSWWDSLIVASAQIGSCQCLLTEDMQTGATYDGVKVVNPFQQSPPL